jgi:DNA invertase Pin-like site-specific DNA recombinase
MRRFRKLPRPIQPAVTRNLSGRREDRVQFQGLMAIARSGKIRAVIVFHTLRSARNVMVSRKYKAELRTRGVALVFLSLPVDATRPKGV